MGKKRNIIIAIDGHSSTGKSTVAKLIAQKLNLSYIDTGAMYRCVTLYAIENLIIKNGEINEEKLKKLFKYILISFKWDKEKGKNQTFLNNKNVEKEIRSIKVSQQVSFISRLKFVREHLVCLQRQMSQEQSVIMEGRDIGTVVFPNADVKIFMTAKAEIRAKRRYEELISKGENVSLEEITKNLIERDEIDQSRKESPLKKTYDSIIIDNTNLSEIEQLDKILEIIYLA